MQYRHIDSSRHLELREFYIDNALLVRLHSAHGWVSINGERLNVNQDTLLIIPRFAHISCHIEAAQQPLTLQTLTLDETLLEELAVDYLPGQCQTDGHYRRYALNTPDAARDNFELLRLTHELVSPTPQAPCLLRQCQYFILKAILAAGVDLFNTLRVKYDEPRERALARLIMTDPGHKWTLEQVAARLYTSPATLRRHLQQEGYSFSKLLLEVRMGVALNYLTFTDFPVSRVSKLSGFHSPAYFCDKFKQHQGMTPLQFRSHSRSGNDILALFALKDSGSPGHRRPSLVLAEPPETTTAK
ncbi:helix-turn-helix transcriptional regulator [Shewanella carassii]|uniref:AraC family transcriptional regulator n=1 Tax=Shewanella carassii TaxID=1987584 RepID=A0ABQ1T7U2_9GAMM|nr:helix-turn-helix domain-containing protein [Shewanella carassii]GGE83480.1 AraC family transcriptional regulator [Shewanella carassii]